jgi:hypothetical protein
MSGSFVRSLAGTLSVTIAVIVLIVTGIVTSPAVFFQIGNVREGDWDYPQVNPRPNRFMRLRGVIDSSLDLKFLVHWTATSRFCHYNPSLMDRLLGRSGPWYSVAWPLRLERDGEGFTANVALDQVWPGRCLWTFGGISIAGGPSLVQTNAGRDSIPSHIVALRCEPTTRELPSGEQLIDCISRTGPVLRLDQAGKDIQVYILRRN